MPNAFLKNIDTSMNVDQFEIMDNNAGGAIIARPQIRGGERYAFYCQPDGSGHGDVNMRNVQSSWVHFDIVEGNEYPL